MNHGAATISLYDEFPTGKDRSVSAFAAGMLTRPPVSNLQGAHMWVRLIFKGGAYDEA
jgi:hypothetical protein